MNKKKDKKDEIVDISTLPKINVVTSSIVLSFKNQDRRSKLLENMYKSTNAVLKLVCKENIIEFAKEKQIFVETPNRKEPNENELAKALAALLIDKSIPIMKEKKVAIDKNEEQKKIKEELINLINNPPPVDPKKPNKDKKKEPQNPDDIKIISEEEFANNCDFMVLLYNYPSNINEYYALENEKLVLNQFLLISELENPNEEPTKADNKAPPKLSPEQILFQKLFASPENPVEFYNLMQNFKLNSRPDSQVRHTFFDKVNFFYKMHDDKKTSTLDTFFDSEVTPKLKSINSNYLSYLKWNQGIVCQKMWSDPNNKETILPEILSEIIKRVNFSSFENEHLSIGSLLYALCSDLQHKYRNAINSKLNNTFSNKQLLDDIFQNFETNFTSSIKKLKSFKNELELNLEDARSDDDKPLSPKTNLLGAEKIIKEVNEKSQREDLDEEDVQNKLKILIIDENDKILKSCLDNEIEGQHVFDKEKELNAFRNHPGIQRYLMPPIPAKEENFRKLKKCEIYPFLKVNIPLYEKYENIRKFEEIFNNKINEKSFDFSDRIYSEVLNRDLLSQELAESIMYDSETLFHYNERDDNVLFSTYYRCPRGRVYRKNWSYRYLSKPDFDNWIKANANNFTTANENNNELKPKSALFRKAPLSGKENLVSKINNIETNENLNDLEKNKDIANFIIDDNILYNVNDNKVGVISEKIKYMFPSDDGVFIKKILSYGVYNTMTSYITKDNLKFGIRKNNEDKKAEFWLKFDNNLSLLMHYNGDYNQKRVNNDAVNGTSITFNLQNGLVIQILPNGDILQKNLDKNDKKISTIKEEQQVDEETHRIITSKASVAKYFKSGKIHIMYANSNVCDISNGLSINTNNKGHRLAKDISNNIEYELDQIPITIQSDIEYNSKNYKLK